MFNRQRQVFLRLNIMKAEQLEQQLQSWVDHYIKTENNGVEYNEDLSQVDNRIEETAKGDK